ncbi:MAG: sigma-70 family RNA polymerase sigma factor [Deltaproteobacteria bacterium]|nr:MAG: sigma-70 family RNA polymerase sigma factor [Deltaproteobacteria bacterium]
MDDLRAAAASAEDARILDALRAGDEKAFLALVQSLNGPMLRVASLYVSSRGVAEEVVQEAWVGVLSGLPRFEGRSSLRRWIFGILANCAKSRGAREARSTPFSDMGPRDDEDEPAVDPSRFLPPDHPRWPGHWSAPPTAWADEQVLNKESLAVVEVAIAQLPMNQREVITLRDVLGWNSAEVCESLGLSEGNQRVLLHRARSKVRGVLEKHFGAGGGR